MRYLGFYVYKNVLLATITSPNGKTWNTTK